MASEKLGVKVKLPNDLCRPELDEWMEKTYGIGGYKEWFGITNLPYRCFEFKTEGDAAFFILRWL